eukprot:2262808-Rhodomonas_salina.2
MQSSSDFSCYRLSYHHHHAPQHCRIMSNAIRSREKKRKNAGWGQRSVYRSSKSDDGDRSWTAGKGRTMRASNFRLSSPFSFSRRRISSFCCLLAAPHAVQFCLGLRVQARETVAGKLGVQDEELCQLVKLQHDGSVRAGDFVACFTAEGLHFVTCFASRFWREAAAAP